MPLLLAATVSLGGCAHYTTSGMRHEAPVLEFDSHKSTNEIVGCVDHAWEKMGNVNFIPNGHGGSVSLAPVAFLLTPMTFLIDIDDQGTIRHVTMWMFKSIWSKQVRHARDQVQACL